MPKTITQNLLNGVLQKGLLVPQFIFVAFDVFQDVPELSNYVLSQLKEKQIHEFKKMTICVTLYFPTKSDRGFVISIANIPLL